MKILPGLTLMALLAAGCGEPLPPAAPAESVLTAAQADARATKRTVFLRFGAHWCESCSRFEEFLASSPVKEILDRHFVSVCLSVDEHSDEKDRENPGADALRKQLGLSAVGIPSYAVLSPKGAPLATSLYRTDAGTVENTSFPMAGKAIGKFLAMLRKATPNITDAELWRLRKLLEDWEPSTTSETGACQGECR